MVRFPRILGHEIGAVIAQADHDVPANFAPRLRVIELPYTQCGTFASWRKRKADACRFIRTMGVQQNGRFCERIALSDQKSSSTNPQNPTIWPLSSLCRWAFTLSRARKFSRRKVLPGVRVVVLDCGMIGMGAIAGAATRRAEVTAADLGAKATFAKADGACQALDAADPDLNARIDARTQGNGDDVVIEAVGLPETFTRGNDLACFGGRMVYTDYPKAPVTYATKFFNLNELDIFGACNAWP